MASTVFNCVRFVAWAWNSIENSINSLAAWWDQYWQNNILDRYFVRINSGTEFDCGFTHVPEESMYFEEVTTDGKTRVLYEGDEIVAYEGNPHKTARIPWLWIGHVPSETDLTRSLHKFIVPGNFIMLDLLMYLSGIDKGEGFMYLDARTMELRKFPVEGIRIET
jgi:hypothetical protein